MVPRYLTPSAVLCALLALPLFAPTKSLAELTVTVRENADSSATFTLSGTHQETLPSPTVILPTTNYSTDVPFYAPPAIGQFYNTALPAGLSLEFTHPGGFVNYDLNEFLCVGPLWYLSGLGELNTSAGTLGVYGRGTVTVPRFPFYIMVPGTYRVNAAEIDSFPEGGDVEEGAVEEGGVQYTGVQPFTVLYKVIPFVRDPSISGQSPGTIKVTSGSRGTGDIQITNTGNVPIVNLALREGSRYFKLGKPARDSLAPGKSTTCPITYSGRRKSSIVKVVITASASDRVYDLGLAGLPEEAESRPRDHDTPEPYIIPGEAVKTAVNVRGMKQKKVASTVRAPRNPVRLLQGNTRNR